MTGSGPPRVVVVGAGPGGLGAAARLAERAAGRVEVVLVARGGTAEHLPGTLAVALGERPAGDFRTRAAPAGVRLVPAGATAIAPGRVDTEAGTLEAAAVIAAPGLELDTAAVPAWPRTAVAWDLESAERAAADLAAVPGGRFVVAACSLPYRCPPAPYSLAMELAARARREGRFTRVCVVTPEPVPLAGVGGEAPAFLMEACAGAGVEVVRSFEVDLAASAPGVLRGRDGREVDYRHALLIPPHRRAAALSKLPADGPLVRVDGRGATLPGVWAVGDCAASGLPRAAGAASWAGRAAADAVLAALGLEAGVEPGAPEASCYVRHGGGSVSRIRVGYPDGPPPAGAARVAIDGPSPDLARAAEGERRRFLALATGTI